MSVKAVTKCQLCDKQPWTRIVIDKESGNIHVCRACRKLVVTD